MCGRFLMCTGNRLSTRLLSTKKRIISGHRKGLELWRGREGAILHSQKQLVGEIQTQTHRSTDFALAYFTSFVATQVLQSHLQAVTPPQDPLPIPLPPPLTTNERSSMRGITNCQQNCDGEGERDASRGGAGAE